MLSLRRDIIQRDRKKKKKKKTKKKKKKKKKKHAANYLLPRSGNGHPDALLDQHAIGYGDYILAPT